MPASLPAINDNYGDIPGRRYVTMVIEEGARTTVHRSPCWESMPPHENKLWPSLVSKPSQPYSLEGAHADRDRILDYLADHGYTHASASWRTTPAKPPIRWIWSSKLCPACRITFSTS